MKFMGKVLELAGLRFEIFKDLMALVWAGIKLTVINAINSIVSNMVKLGNNIIDFVNKLIAAFNRLPGPNIPDVPPLNVKAFKISTAALEKEVIDLSATIAENLGKEAKLEAEIATSFKDIFAKSKEDVMDILPEGALQTPQIPMTPALPTPTLGGAGAGGNTFITNIENLTTTDPTEAGMVIQEVLETKR